MKIENKSTIVVRDLKSGDLNSFANFLLALKSKTLHHWNRFGPRFNLSHAKQVSRDQISKKAREEKGFTAWNGEKMVGYGYLRFFPDKPQKRGTASLGMVVLDSYQGCGIGTLLMKHMIDYCRKKQLKKIWLATYSDNKQTKNFYRHFGFYPEGVFLFDEYFGRNPRHVISMAKFLDPKLAKQAKTLTKQLLSR